MTTLQLAAAVQAPDIDYKGLSPLFAIAGGTIAVLMAGLLRPRFARHLLVPLLAVISLGAAIGVTVWLWEPGDAAPILQGSLQVDALSLGLSMLFYVAGIVVVLLSWRETAVATAGHGEYYALLLASIAGMTMLAQASSLITLFIAIELLSIPLYVLCASHVRRAESLEAGLKYLIIGSVGSATLLYGLALLYGATGSVRFTTMATAIGDTVPVGDPLLLTGIALAATGLAFKASVAPFHQWTPDVYEGAPTPVTAFMSVTTKVAAFAVLLRLFDEALGSAQLEWGPALAALATVSIVIGNVGAIAQRSLKRLLAWSSIAQAGYLLAGVVVGTALGLQATAFYLAAYFVMNIAAFAVVVARERVSGEGDDISSIADLGRQQPWLAWPMTIAMLSLAGFPATAGFIGKFYLIDASVAGDYTWLGIVIVVGSVISLAYYLRVVAVMWMGSVDVALPGGRVVKRAAGWSQEADTRAQPEVAFVALLFAIATIVIGIWPDPLFDLAVDIGKSIPGIG